MEWEETHVVTNTVLQREGLLRSSVPVSSTCVSRGLWKMCAKMNIPQPHDHTSTSRLRMEYAVTLIPVYLTKILQRPFYLIQYLTGGLLGVFNEITV